MLKFNKYNKLLFHPTACCQCGVCLSLCPVSALTKENGHKTLYTIKVDKKKCIKCSRCVENCPAHIVSNEQLDEKWLDDAKGIYLAYAADEHVRWAGSSGGVARTLITQTLKKGNVCAVYSLIYPECSCDDSGVIQKISVEAEGRWLESPPEVHQIPGSLYRPVLWGENLMKNLPREGRAMLVGLPCQLKAAKALIKKTSPHLDMISVTIFCRKQKTFGYSKYLQRLSRLKSMNPWAVVYRGGGWPGKIGVLDGARSSFVDFFFPAWSWNLPGCRFCTDCMNAHDSDLTVTDPWNIIPVVSEEKGQNLVLTWTDAGENLLRGNADVLMLNELPSDRAEIALNFQVIKNKTALAGYYQGCSVPLNIRIQAMAGLLKANAGQFVLFIIPHNSGVMRTLRKMLVIFK